MARVVCKVQPRFVFVENSPMLTSRGLHRVLGDLAEMGYNARWCVLGADDAGAPHRRKRIWILAYAMPTGKRRKQWKGEIKENAMAYSGSYPTRTKEALRPKKQNTERENTRNSRVSWWGTDPADMGYTKSIGRNEKQTQANSRRSELQGEAGGRSITERGSRRSTKPEMGRMADGVDSGVDLSRSDVFGKIPRVEIDIRDSVDRLKAIGNGQVPITAAIAFTILSEGLI